MQKFFLLEIAAGFERQYEAAKVILDTETEKGQQRRMAKLANQKLEV